MASSSNGLIDDVTRESAVKFVTTINSFSDRSISNEHLGFLFGLKKNDKQQKAGRLFVAAQDNITGGSDVGRQVDNKVITELISTKNYNDASKYTNKPNQIHPDFVNFVFQTAIYQGLVIAKLFENIKDEGSLLYLLNFS